MRSDLILPVKTFTFRVINLFWCETDSMKTQNQNQSLTQCSHNSLHKRASSRQHQEVQCTPQAHREGKHSGDKSQAGPGISKSHSSPEIRCGRDDSLNVISQVQLVRATDVQGTKQKACHLHGHWSRPPLCSCSSSRLWLLSLNVLLTLTMVFMVWLSSLYLEEKKMMLESERTEGCIPGDSNSRMHVHDAREAFPNL